MRLFSLMGVWAGLALAAIVLAACVVVEENPRPWPPSSGGEPSMCTREYDPVCGQRGGDRQTFSNACLARADGYRIVAQGECRRERPQQACTMDYRPVCAERGRNRQTFSNACMARADGFNVIHEGECRRGGDNRPDRACTREYVPVCARRGRDTRTFGNACMAEAEDYRIIRNGPC